MVWRINSLQELKKLARAFAKKAARRAAKRRGALVIGLVGDLGAGKTTFAQAFLRSFGIRGRITSPTFILMKRYEFRGVSRFVSHGFASIFHIDCYRFKKPQELITLGFKEILADPKNIVVIELADRVKKILPKNTLWLYFEHGKKENERFIKTRNYSPIPSFANASAGRRAN